MPLHVLHTHLQQQGFLVLDGAMATELEKYGADLNDPLWSAKCLLDSPQLIRQVHLDYLNSGADIISSATYQASQAGFQARGLSVAKSVKLMRSGVALALQARDAFWSDPANHAGRLRPLVAVSLGPFGACLHDGSEYHGNYSASDDEIRDFHIDRLNILTGQGADLLAFETIPSQREAGLIAEVLRAYPQERAWLAFSCRNETALCHGESFSTCAREVAAHRQMLAVGINCSAPQFITPLLQSVRAASGVSAETSDPLKIPLLVYPNSGETWVACDNRWQGHSTAALEARTWFAAGARLIGGCCRTGPEDIAAMRAALAAATQ